jgi:hypothetical protein
MLAGSLLLLRLLGLPWATAAVRRSDFPASFLFGTATSSYQVIPPHHRPLDLSFALLPSSLARPMQIVVSSVIRMRRKGVFISSKKIFTPSTYA